MENNKWLKKTSSEVMDSVNALNMIQTSIGSILYALGDKLPESVLCIGVADGTELHEWDRLGVAAEGVEINQESRNKASSRGFIVHDLDMHDLSPLVKKYELVFTRDVFEHSISHIQVIEQMANVSSKYVAITLPDSTWGDSEIHYIIPTLEQMIYLGMKVNLSLRHYRVVPVISGQRLITQYIYLFEKHD